jgi:ribosomal protein S4
MFKIKKRRHKPLYKKFISLRANVQYKQRLQLLKFKKQKWQKLMFYLERLQNRRKKKFKIYDLNRYYLPKFYNLFKRKYKSILLNKKKFSLFYGGLLHSRIKKEVNFIIQNKKKMLKKGLNFNLFFISLFEKKLDVILYRSHFVKSIKNAQQLIIHKHIKINNLTVTNKFYTLKKGDIIKINSKIIPFIKSNLFQSHIWPIPPKYLQINYKTFQIIFTGNIDFLNIATLFPFWPDIFFLLRYCR